MRTKIFLISVLLMLFTGICYANPIVVGVPYGGKLDISTNLGLMINLAADFTALCLGFLIIRKFRALLCWRFLPYLVLVFFGGIVLDVMAIVPIKLFFFFIPIEDPGIFILFLLAGLFLYLFNSWLSEKFFDLELNEKVVIGVVMALLTNPVISSIIGG